MNRRLVLVALTALTLSACGAEGMHRPSPPALPSDVAHALYEPGFVLAHAEAIHLAPVVGRSIEIDARATQAQWDALAPQLVAATTVLATTLGSPHVDEQTAADRGAEVMRIEVALKSTHLALLVRVKNRLTPVQQRQLDVIRRRAS